MSRRALEAAALCSAVLALAVGLPVTATAKKPTVKAPSGLACLVGRWISNGIKTPDISGLAGTVLTITRSSVGQNYVNADADYDRSTPIRVVSPAVPSTLNSYVKVDGSVFARIYYISYKGQGSYKFTKGPSSEDVTVYGDGIKLVGPVPVQNSGGYTNLTCNATRLSTTLVVPSAKGGTQTVKVSFGR
jgi:hypothetical protein